MKRKDDIRAKGKGQRAKGRKPEVGSRKSEDKNAGMQECRSAGMKRKCKTVPGAKQPETSSQPPIAIGAVTSKNSTVFHNKRLSPVIIDFSREELAIRACDLLRIFNN